MADRTVSRALVLAEEALSRAVDRAGAFRDADAAVLERQWRVEVARRRRLEVEAQLRRGAGHAGAAAVLMLGLVLMALDAAALGLVLIGVAVVLGIRQVRAPAVPALPTPPRPTALPSVPRSSGAFAPLRETVAARTALRGLLTHVPADVATLARPTAWQVESTIATLATSLRDLETAQASSGFGMRSAAKLRTDLASAVSAYRSLVSTVDEVAAQQRLASLDEIEARLAGIQAAVRALQP
jgi:hypothetical protein